MDPQKFANSPIGDLVPISGTDVRGERYEHVAYAAHPLMGPPELGTSTWASVARANRALGRLQQGSLLIINPGLLRQPTLRREAQSTSALEGTYAPLEDVLAADVIEGTDRSAALNEVLNYVVAAENGFQWVQQQRPLTSGLLCDLHRTLVQGTPADTAEAGRVRRVQVVIGSRGRDVTSARFIPMPEGAALEAAVGDLIRWMQISQDDLDPIVATAMAHYQFETLHPFNDGNGRIGRLLIVLQLVALGVLPEGLLSVSPWFESRRERYQDLLAEVSATGRWDNWIRFFADAIEASAVDSAQRISQLLKLQADYHEALRASGARGAVRDIVDILIGSPFVSIPLLRDRTGLTYQAVSNAVRRLEELDILEQRKTSGVMSFRAPGVVDVISAPSAS
ncbi:Fic family protein [Microbacterium resistens]|uniref:Fic family protein n=1 Tax=Microbacterium resistens TaxID=156977 RepID=A0ABU1SAB7_9MICO|nr:Fic/DOC family N-terminal domain-containing protein [Microbacterium resistens]MDR6866552.1 Fic family protein [Microbacterium resistens]